MTRLRPGDRAWLVLAAGVVAWEVSCPPDELLSEAADRYMLRHPWLTRAVAFTLAAHVCNALPDRYDPIHRLFLLKGAGWRAAHIWRRGRFGRLPRLQLIVFPVVRAQALISSRSVRVGSSMIPHHGEGGFR